MNTPRHHRPSDDIAPTRSAAIDDLECPCGDKLSGHHRLVRPQLGERECEAVLNWLRHDSKKAAAREMYVTESTLSKHIERVRRKYNDLGRPAPTKAHMLVRAIQDGLIGLDDF